MVLSVVAALVFAPMSVHLSEPEEGAPIELAYTYRLEEPVRYTLSSDETIIQSGFGRLVIDSNRSTMGLTRSVIDRREDGSLVIEESIDTYSYEQTVGDTTFSFDSTKPEDEPKALDARVAVQYAALGWKPRLHLAADGEVLAIVNHPELMKHADSIDDEELRELVKESYAEREMIAESTPFMQLLPDHPVSVGDQWTQSFVIGGAPETLTVFQTMTLAYVSDRKEGKSVRITIEGNVHATLPPDAPAFLEVTQHSIKGTFYFDTHLGVVTSYSSTVTLELSGTPGEGIPEVSLLSNLRTEYKMESPHN